MRNDLVKQALAELQDLVSCRCHEAYKDRKLHDPDCHCDDAAAVKIVADYVEELEAELAEATVKRPQAYRDRIAAKVEEDGK